MPCAFSTSFEDLVRLGSIECSDGVSSDEEKTSDNNRNQENPILLEEGEQYRCS